MKYRNSTINNGHQTEGTDLQSDLSHASYHSPLSEACKNYVYSFGKTFLILVFLVIYEYLYIAFKQSFAAMTKTKAHANKSLFNL